jgi:hypothetical protein
MDVHECGHCYLGFEGMAKYKSHMTSRHPENWQAYVNYLGAEPTDENEIDLLLAARDRDEGAQMSGLAAGFGVEFSRN